jgi:hypothetical protein
MFYYTKQNFTNYLQEPSYADFFCSYNLEVLFFMITTLQSVTWLHAWFGAREFQFKSGWGDKQVDLE